MTPSARRVLIADDQADILHALKLLLEAEGYEATTARSPAEVLDRVGAGDFDVAILDLNYTRDTTSGQEGLDLMEQLRTSDPLLPVIVMTAWSSVAGAVEAMRRGARDYVEKPWSDDRLLATVRTSICGARWDGPSGSRKRARDHSAATRRCSSATQPPFARSG